MLKIGQLNNLSVVKSVEFGLYLDGGEWGEVLLPQRYAPKDAKVGDMLTVFIYFDSEDRIIATTETPKAMVGEFAYLRVVDVNPAGAFLDWGLSKDVLAPYSEQATKMREGAYYMVRLFQDEESERVTASSKIDSFLDKVAPEFQADEAVDLIIVSQTDLGYKAIVNHSHWGVLYADEVFTSLQTGQKIAGNIKKVRADNKIDLYLKSLDKSNLSELEQLILDKLEINHGLLRVGDKSEPEVIYKLFSVSKKNFKRALSSLYKKRLIVIEVHGISLAKKA